MADVSGATTVVTTKAWYTSKTLWVNAIAIAAGAVAPKLGIVIDADMQLTILGVINIILRIVTKAPVTFS